MTIITIAITILAVGGHCGLDLSRLRDKGDFSSQLSYLLDSVRITPEAIDAITEVYQDVAVLMQQLWPESEIKAFGATASGLGTRSSDVDCLVDIPTTNLTVAERALAAKAHLETQPQLFTNIQVVDIPTETFLKIQHVPKNQDVDLTFTKPGCVMESALIRFYLDMDQRASDLAMFLKYWAKQHQLIGLYWMPSFSIAIKTIFYLQQVKILPSVLDLQSNTKRVIINNWDTSFNNNFDYILHEDYTLYQLLGGFFEYYSNFDYDRYIVSVYAGRPLERDSFKNLDDVPEEFQLYKHNVRSNITNPLKLGAKMIIQDPFEHNNNSGEYVCLQTVERIVSHFKYAAEMFTQKGSDEYLPSILSVSDSSVMRDTSCWR